MIFRRTTSLVVSVLTIAIATALTPAQAGPEEQLPEYPDSRKEGTLIAPYMSGDQVVPGPGDPDGSCSGTIPIDSRINRICWNVQTKDLQLPLSGALIRVGAAGDEGPEEYRLFPDTFVENPSGCRTEPGSEIRDLLQNSRDFYLEIYSADFDEGAIRGQLSLSNDA